MNRRQVIGPDTNTERTGAQIYRDVRPGSTKFLLLLRTAFGGFMVIGLGFIGLIVPAALNLVLLIGLGLIAYIFAGPVILPFRLPRHSGLKDRNHPLPGSRKPRRAAGTYLLGHVWNSNHQVWAADDDLRQGVPFLGTTGAGKTRGIISILTNALLQASGFTIVDGKADNQLYGDIIALARRVGREDDVLAQNYLVASGNRDTNTFNPFATCNADVLRELLVSQIEENPSGGGDSNGVFRAGAIALLGSLAPVLVWVRDHHGIPIDIERIRFATELRSVASIATKKKFLIRKSVNSDPEEIDIGDIPGALIYPLRAYLGETGNYELDLDWNRQKSTEPSRQHSFVLLHFRQTFTQLAVSLGHIFKCQNGDIDMRDVVLNRRILVVNLPALENSGETTAALGKIVVATMRNMMAQVLGANLEGKFEEIIENKPSLAPSAYPVALDEVGYYAVPGMDKMLAMGRALGFAFLLGFQEIAGIRARIGDSLYSWLGNLNLQILMRLQEGGPTREYVENTVGDSFVTQVSGYDSAGVGGYQETSRTDVQRTKRVDFADLRSQIEGEAVILFGPHRMYVNLLYINPAPKGWSRLNRPIQMAMVDRSLLGQACSEAAAIARELEIGFDPHKPLAYSRAIAAILEGMRRAVASGRVLEGTDLADQVCRNLHDLPETEIPAEADGIANDLGAGDGTGVPLTGVRKMVDPQATKPPIPVLQAIGPGIAEADRRIVVAIETWGGADAEAAQRAAEALSARVTGLATPPVLPAMAPAEFHRMITTLTNHLETIAKGA
ncbi:MAG: type IV secretion system DNA-binding domain-containing protein [Acidiphilium sp.]|nr:type IV secretion system DNA-binding domain-containing protein [Acidiphilium sp.]MDD4937080.1 type IV secretion system DNA-binding domain-containing protein [Acidiphilium sp.]